MTLTIGPGAPQLAVDPWEDIVPKLDVSEGSGYFTPGELLAWMAEVGGKTYDEMRLQMNGTEQRKELQEDLSSFKALLEGTKTTKDFVKLQNSIYDLKAKYAGTPFEARANSVFGAHDDEMARIEQLSGDIANHISRGDLDSANAVDDVREATVSSLIDQFDSWCTDIQGKIDSLATEDQLALIKIQELNSQVTQATQLASNILAAQDQAASTAIMNLKV